MAVLMLIKKDSLSDKDNRQVNDIVGIYEDGHVPTKHEQNIYAFVTIKGTREEVEAMFPPPEVRSVIRTQTVDWVFEEDAERKEAWKDGDNYREIKEAPRLTRAYDPEKKTIIETFSRQAENKETTLISAPVERR
jgi:hypothetical protein